MSDLNESGSSSRQNPLTWVSLAVVGLIIFIFISGDRGKSLSVSETDNSGEAAGAIERNVLLPPGLRARQYIEQIRNEGKPYPLPEAYDKAQDFMREGSLADAHLMYFFAAREEHVPSIMKMAEMSDPTLFLAENSLLDNADVIQAYKWYQKAAAMGHQPASERISGLRQWANEEAEAGNPHARQLLLNFR